MNKLFRNIISNKELKDKPVKSSIIKHFEDRLNEFHSEFMDTETKITSANYVADRLLANLEALFLHGLKETFISQLSSVIGDDVDKSTDINFWHCILVISPSGIVDHINSLKHVTTDVGKCRAWIRSTLNDGVFRSYLTSMVKYRRYIVKFYNKTAVVRDPECFRNIIALMDGIDQYNFDLTLNSSLLNTWPTTTLLLAGYWTPALKNNPLYNNNPQIAEAVDVNDIDDAVLINDHNRSEESYTSSVSSSFVDAEIFRKPPHIMNEDIAWQLLMKQPSTSYATSKNIDTSDVVKDDVPSIEITNDQLENQSSESDIKEGEGVLEISTSEPKTNENITKIEPVQSFNDLLMSYDSRIRSSSNSPISNFENMCKRYSIISKKIIEQEHFDNSGAVNSDEDDFVQVSMHPECLSLDLLKQYLEYLFAYPKESGLNVQDYTCKSCNETIGINFGDYFKCNFTACYYCVHCIGTEMWPIPVNVLFNWDFNHYPVSTSSSKFLSEIQYHPLFNMRSIHNKLYKANQEMVKSKKLRWQIYYLYHYLSTCKFYNIEELFRDVWPRVYFFNNIHLYSFADLQEIYSGTLFEFLEDKIETSREHVYHCPACSQKGFICEICRDPKIIYPFDLVNNHRCRHCKTVFHQKCHDEKKSCPKCERDKIRTMKKNFNDDDQDNASNLDNLE